MEERRNCESNCVPLAAVRSRVNVLILVLLALMAFILIPTSRARERDQMLTKHEAEIETLKKSAQESGRRIGQLQQDLRRVLQGVARIEGILMRQKQPGDEE